jgi:hypothetical protein
LKSFEASGRTPWPCFQGLSHEKLLLFFLAMLPNQITFSQEQLHVQFLAVYGLLLLGGNSVPVPVSSSLVADGKDNLMGMQFVPETRCISDSKD